MADIKTVLLKELKKKKIISTDLEKESESIICENIPFDKPNDLYIRDAITTLVLASGEKGHFASGEKGQFQSDLEGPIIKT